jgi:hypothetical protein
LFSTLNVAFARGTEPGASIRVGPGFAGLMVMIPSIPDSIPEGLCPVATERDMRINPKVVSKL